MTRYVISSFLMASALLFTACGGGEESSEEKETKEAPAAIATDTAATIDTLSAESTTPEPAKRVFSEEQLTMLKKYIDDAMVAKLEAYHHQFYNASTEQEFVALLDSNYSIRSLFLTKIQESDTYRKIAGTSYDDAVFGLMKEFPAEEWKELVGMNVSCVAECTESDIAIQANDLLEQAKLTKGTADETYMQIAIDAYGPYESAFAAWFNQTWDYGGSSWLGSGKHLKFFQRIDAAMVESNLFDARYKAMRRDLMHDMLNFRSFMKTADVIMAELQQILDGVNLSDEEKEKIKARIEMFKDPEANELELDCENTNCAYG